MTNTTINAGVLRPDFVQGTVCPVCGGDKSSGAYTCYDCRAGHKNKGLLAEAFEAFRLADETVAKHNGARPRVLGPIICQLPVSLEATTNPAQNGFAQNQALAFSIGGGRLNCYFFGGDEEDKGKVVTVLVELKTKTVGGNDTVHYLRAQKIPTGLRSNVRLSVQAGHEGKGLTEDLPIVKITDHLKGNRDKQSRCLMGTIGFRLMDEGNPVVVIEDETVEQELTEKDERDAHIS
jgi:hypothetical protein